MIIGVFLFNQIGATQKIQNISKMSEPLPQSELSEKKAFFLKQVAVLKSITPVSKRSGPLWKSYCNAQALLQKLPQGSSYSVSLRLETLARNLLDLRDAVNRFNGAIVGDNKKMWPLTDGDKMLFSELISKISSCVDRYVTSDIDLWPRKSKKYKLLHAAEEYQSIIRNCSHVGVTPIGVRLLMERYKNMSALLASDKQQDIEAYKYQILNLSIKLTYIKKMMLPKHELTLLNSFFDPIFAAFCQAKKYFVMVECEELKNQEKVKQLYKNVYVKLLDAMNGLDAILAKFYVDIDKEFYSALCLDLVKLENSIGKESTGKIAHKDLSEKVSKKRKVVKKMIDKAAISIICAFYNKTKEQFKDAKKTNILSILDDIRKIEEYFSCPLPCSDTGVVWVWDEKDAEYVKLKKIRNDIDRKIIELSFSVKSTCASDWHSICFGETFLRILNRVCQIDPKKMNAEMAVELYFARTWFIDFHDYIKTKFSNVKNYSDVFGEQRWFFTESCTDECKELLKKIGELLKNFPLSEKDDLGKAKITPVLLPGFAAFIPKEIENLKVLYDGHATDCIDKCPIEKYVSDILVFLDCNEIKKAMGNSLECCLVRAKELQNSLKRKSAK